MRTAPGEFRLRGAPSQPRHNRGMGVPDTGQGSGTSTPYASKGFLNVIRLLAAASMLSAMAAVLRFESTTSQGRVLIALGVLTSLSGQLFLMQASKSKPPAWVNVPLTLLGIGLAAIVLAWIVALG